MSIMSELLNDSFLIHPYQNPKLPEQELLGLPNTAIEDQDYMEKIKQLEAYLDMVDLVTD